MIGDTAPRAELLEGGWTAGVSRAAPSYWTPVGPVDSRVEARAPLVLGGGGSTAGVRVSHLPGTWTERR